MRIFQKNVGTLDRSIRLLVALAALITALAVGAGSTGGIVLLVVTAIAAVTGASGRCPLYGVLGVSTLHQDRHQHGLVA
ncbi:MAG: YgaP family membrane protein [Acidimicrobiales bacterium]|jgi:hypothetical protein